MRVVTRVDDVRPDVWGDETQPGALFSSADWFRVAELSGSGVEFMLADTSTPVALPYHSKPVGAGGAYDHEFHVLKPALGEFSQEWKPILVVGSWASTISRGALGDQASENFAKATEEVVSQILCLAGERENRAVSWPFLTRDAARLVRELVPQNSLILRSLPTTLLTIGHESFDDYLAALSSRTRWSFMRDERKFSNASLRLNVEPLSQILHETANLYADGRQLGRGRLETEATHNALTNVLGDHVLAFTARQGEKLAAVATAIVSHGGVYLRSFAADKEVAGSEHAYFVLTYNAPRRFAFEHGLRWIHAGVHAYEAKARRDFRLWPLWTAFITSRNVTEKERGLGNAWNIAQESTWREWYKTKLGEDLPAEWKWQE